MKHLKLVTLALTVSSLAMLASACDKSSKEGSGATSAAAPVAKNADAVKVEFYVMSQCPYGVQVMNGVKESLDALGPDADFHFDFIGQKSPTGELTSMHGPNEVTGDIVQLSAAKQAPAAAMNMIFCQNKAPKDVATNWEACAKEAGIADEPLKTCLTGEEGKTLLTESFARSTAKGASGSPTIYVAGKPYQGRRSPKDFLRNFCSAHTGPVPAACAKLPEQPQVNATLLSDKRCTDCNADRYVGMLDNQVGKVSITRLDYGDEAGRKLYDEVSPAGDAQLPMICSTIRSRLTPMQWRRLAAT